MPIIAAMSSVVPSSLAALTSAPAKGSLACRAWLASREIELICRFVARADLL